MARTSLCTALGFRFFVVADDEPFVERLDRLFAPMRDLDANEPHVASRGAGSAPPTGHVHLMAADGAEIWSAPQSDAVVTQLVQAINRRAIVRWPGVALHAGVVASGATGIVMPGVMEAGKTTLVTGLVRAGLAYLSDEAAALDPQTLLVEPFPKPLSIDPGAWALFPELAPEAHQVDSGPAQWQIAPQDVGTIGAACKVSVIAFPRYRSGSVTDLIPVSSGDALVEATKHTFGFSERARESLDVLAEIVGGAECYRFAIGDLPRAVDIMLDLLASSPPPVAAEHR